jgi:dienelactone hydrolase
VSWYEAEAYARFVGFQLPTIYHWMMAASPHQGHLVLPVSNVDGSGTAQVGEHEGMSEYGAFDVAGNVREWTANAMEGGRIILGGSFEDPSYMFSNAFAIYRDVYQYQDGPLNGQVESRDTTPDWVREFVSFEGPDGGERVVAHLFLPPEGNPPYQTLVFFPGASSLSAGSLSQYNNFAALVQGFTRTGRAILLPAYKGTLERRAGAEVASWYPNPTTEYRDRIITIGKEVRRSVDYLESRPELVDTTRIAYFGNSWGGSVAGVMVAIEPRFKAAVLQCPGLTFVRPLPEVDPLHFLPRVSVPVLMVDGQHDAIFPVEASQIPMFELLGVDGDQKRHVIFDAAHCPARTLFHGEALDWLDRHLGPVR